MLEANNLSYYYKEIGSIPILTPEEELDNLKRAKQGDTVARDKLIISNLRLVALLAKKYANKGAEFEDLVQEGNLGLIQAIESFDLNYENRFTTYASYWINQYLYKAIAEKTKILKVPSDKIHLMIKIKKFQNQYLKIYEEYPNLKDISEALKIDIDLIKELIELNKEPIFLNSVINEDGNTAIELGETIEDENSNIELNYMEQVKKEGLLNIINTLSEREAQIIIMRFGLDNAPPRTLEEIGEFFGNSKERIRQLESSALKKLRQPNRLSKILEVIE